MTLSTSVTNPIHKRFRKTGLAYGTISLFFLVFSRIYEHFSFGESSLYMHWLFALPLLGGGILLGLLKIIPNLSRLSLNLWNSAIATATAGCLLRGIINLSGRSTTLDLPYWFVSAGFLLLAILSILLTRSEWVDDTI